MIVVVPVDPPREEIALSSLVDESPLEPAMAVDLYAAAVADVVRAVEDSGGDLLVNYRDEETVPEEFDAGDPEAEIRDLVSSALEDDADVRFERQVGSSRSARVGNTVTHLLEREEADGVVVLEPTAALVGRSEIDGTAMSLRRHDVVLGPSAAGGIYMAAFTEPIDFADAYASPSLATLARAVEDAGLDLGFAPRVPTIATEPGLRATIATLEARAVADRRGGEATAAVLEEHGLGVGGDGPLEW